MRQSRSLLILEEATSKAPRAKPAKIDPKYIAAARELRDRYLEQVNGEQVNGERVNGNPLMLEEAGKYDVRRMLSGESPKSPRIVPSLPAAA